jgi:hypothetical protein
MAGTLTPNEEAQLVQTIGMFEEIVQCDPMDYQSLEILKEAYSKLGRDKDTVSTSKRIAQAYVQLGQLSSAILEYESILQRYPDDPDVQRALTDIENKATSFSAPLSLDSDFTEKASAAAALRKTVDDHPLPVAEIDDGKQPMQKIFLESRLITQGDFNACWPPPPAPADRPKQPYLPFVQLLADKQVLPIERSLRLLCEKTRLGFLPIEKYDIDLDLVRGFPKEICYRWCVLPFDRMSKSTLVATSNPFNKQASREVEAQLKGRVLWYMVSPAELAKVLKKVYR